MTEWKVKTNLGVVFISFQINEMLYFIKHKPIISEECRRIQNRAHDLGQLISLRLAFHSWSSSETNVAISDLLRKMRTKNSDLKFEKKNQIGKDSMWQVDKKNLQLGREMGKKLF